MLADPIRVFISYAREDQPQAVRLVKELRAMGFEPRLDLEYMVGGVDWRYRIEQELDSCQYVVLLLSSNSIEKTGYVQVEKRYILERLDHRPLGDIYLVPARLEECRARHPQINNLHYVDLFPSWDDGVRQIAKALGRSDDQADTYEPATSGVELELSVRDYFEVVLPTMLKWKGNDATILNKRLRFFISDLNESWTVCLTPPEATVVAGGEDKVDLTLKITSKVMQDILGGRFDARKAIADGEIELYGDLKLLKPVGSLFQGKS